MDLVMVYTIIFAVVIFIAAAVTTFLFTRSVVRQINGATDTFKYITKDEVGDFEEMLTNIQPAATTLINNNVRVNGLIESYEEGLAEMQEVVADIREIISTIDTVLQEFERH